MKYTNTGNIDTRSGFGAGLLEAEKLKTKNYISNFKITQKSKLNKEEGIRISTLKNK
ncbi:MAG: hypothetical protein LBV69_09165 [Bacteroidales bacterium]|jgi:hypothetical protein|nr:hypothetical protein [Bacteroidales bacterium]